MIPDDPERGVPWSSSAEEKDKESSVIPRQECHKRKQTMNSSMKIRVYKAGVVQSLASNSSPSSTRVLCESFPRLSEENQRTLPTMKFIHLALVLFCAVAYAAAQAELEDPRESHIPARFRRQTEPKGSVSIQATKPMSGPDRRPSVDVDYHQRIFEKNGANANAYGGLNIRPGQPPQPHIGIQAERNYNNGFIRGYGQVQRGPGGRPSPTIGVSGGFRFRRDVDFELGDQELH